MKPLAAAALPSSLGHAQLDALAAAADRHETHERGVRVVWRRWGRGRPLILLHGGHGNWMHWACSIDALASDRSVWVADMPGYGESADLPRDPEPLVRLEALTEALANSVDALLPRSLEIDIAGFSFGGLVATDLALQRGRVGRLALLGTAGHGGTRRQQQALRAWRHDDLDARLDALRHNLGVFMLHEPGRIDALALAIHKAACENTRLRSREISRMPLLQARLDRLSCRTLLLWGEHDVTAEPVQQLQALTRDRPNRRGQLVPGGGHWIQYERANEVNALLNAWLSTPA